MSSQPEVDCDGCTAGIPETPARVHVRFSRRRWLQIIGGCVIALFGLLQLSRGLALFAGTNGYGTRLEFNHGELFYTSAVSADDAQRLGTFLVQEKFFGGQRNSVQFTKAGPTLKVRIVVQPGYEKNESYLGLCGTFGAQISEKLFHGAPLDIELCDSHLQTLLVVPAAAVLELNHGQLYYAAPISRDQAKRVGAILVREKYFGGAPVRAQLTKQVNAVHVLLPVRSALEKDESYDSAFRGIAASMSEEIFQGAPVEVTLCNDQLKVMRVLSANQTLVFNRGQLNYAKDVAKEDARRLGQFLVADHFFDGRLLSVVLTKVGKTWHVRYLSMKPAFVKDEGYVAACGIFASRTSLHVFHSAPVVIELCDAKGKTLRALPAAVGLEFNRGELFFTSSISRDDAEQLGQFLVREKFFGGQPISAQFTKNGPTLQFRLPVRQGLDKDESYLATCRTFAGEVSQVFGGAPVEIYLCDKEFKTLRVVPLGMK